MTTEDQPVHIIYRCPTEVCSQTHSFFSKKILFPETTSTRFLESLHHQIDCGIEWLYKIEELAVRCTECEQYHLILDGFENDLNRQLFADRYQHCQLQFLEKVVEGSAINLVSGSMPCFSMGHDVQSNEGNHPLFCHRTQIDLIRAKPTSERSEEEWRILADYYGG